MNKMRVAIFSDVHGNLTALEAVLNDIATQQVDQVLFAGDLCLIGPRPAECLQWVKTARIASVYGNTDDWILRRQMPPERLQALCDWTLAQLSAVERAWLTAVPFSHRLSPTSNLTDDLLVVHANPYDVNQLVFPPESEQQVRYGQVRQTDGALAELLAGAVGTTAVIAYGHLHVPSIRQVNGVTLVNISSVNMAGDGDPRAKYGLLEWDGQQWHAQHRRVAWDAEAEIDAYRQAQPPGWENFVAQLEQHGTVPQNV